MSFAARLRAIEKRMPKVTLTVEVEPGANASACVREEVFMQKMEHRKPIITALFLTSRRGDEVFDKSRAWSARYDVTGRRLKP